MGTEKVIVSACLLGDNCRYDGTTKAHAGVIGFLKDKTVIPFCPEAPVLGTPRGRISVVMTQDFGIRVLKDVDGADVTGALTAQTRSVIDAHPDASRIILKSRSPSCGIGTTPILDALGVEISKGNGIAAAYLLEAFPAIDIVDESAF